MGTGLSALSVAVATLLGASISESSVERQNQVFQRFWGTDFEWKFDELPAKGGVPESRVPYSGHIYLDRAGGTMSSLRKYDLAFNGGRSLATAHEQWDTTAFKKPVPRRGLFGFRIGTTMETPNWHGHCNGWTAAAIRHAEPQQNVRRNGVVFTPADIKGLLAEIYIYNDYEHVAGLKEPMNAGLFHALIANWLGRGAHPLGMEADPGPEKWNYPAYSYSTSSAKRGDRHVEVRMNLVYAKDSQGEFQQSPRLNRTKSFHYRLDLNEQGQIVGGNFYSDSSIIDMLWVPLRPKASRQPGHESGNPYVNVDTVLQLWRDSVPEEVRAKWTIIDPPSADRVTNVADIHTLVPLQDVATPTVVAATGDQGTTVTAAPAAEAPPASDPPATATPETPAIIAPAANPDPTVSSAG